MESLILKEFKTEQRETYTFNNETKAKQLHFSRYFFMNEKDFIQNKIYGLLLFSWDREMHNLYHIRAISYDLATFIED